MLVSIYLAIFSMIQQHGWRGNPWQVFCRLACQMIWPFNDRHEICMSPRLELKSEWTCQSKSLILLNKITTYKYSHRCYIFFRLWFKYPLTKLETQVRTSSEASRPYCPAAHPHPAATSSWCRDSSGATWSSSSGCGSLSWGRGDGQLGGSRLFVFLKLCYIIWSRSFSHFGMIENCGIQFARLIVLMLIWFICILSSTAGMFGTDSLWDFPGDVAWPKKTPKRTMICFSTWAVFEHIRKDLENKCQPNWCHPKKKCWRNAEFRLDFNPHTPNWGSCESYGLPPMHLCWHNRWREDWNFLRSSSVKNSSI